MSDMNAWAVVMLGAFALVAFLASLITRPSRRARICVACGHERGWHLTYLPLPSTSGGSLGCAKDGCGCPAGRRSIR